MKIIKMLAVSLAIILLISGMVGCGQPVNVQEGSESAGATDAKEEEPEEMEDEPIILVDPPIEMDVDDDFGDVDIGMGESRPLTPEEFTEGLIENEAPSLVVEAVVLERMAILPGSTIRVSVTISNQGDETIAFVKGSGSYEIPEALRIFSDDLQPILSPDRLGFATMDFVVETLEPGETRSYSLYVRAVRPNENFDNYTFQLFAEGEGYMGELDWETVSRRFPDLFEVESGTHRVSVYFIYNIVNSEEMDMFGMEATGFNRATLEILVD